VIEDEDVVEPVIDGIGKPVGRRILVRSPAR